MKRIRVDHLPLSDDTALDTGASHHLVNVLRHTVGDEVLLVANGLEQTARIVEVGPPVLVAPTAEPNEQAALVPIHLIVSVLKHQAMDLALRLATETGATSIQPVLMERTVARGDRHDRWKRILVSAASQCGRADLPELHPVRPLAHVLEDLDVPLLYGAPGATAAPAAEAACALVIGPAGGLGRRDLERLQRHQARPVGLGPHILRAETAVAVALGLLRR